MLAKEHVQSLFDYDSASGFLRWKVGRRLGRPAGCVDSDGYLRVKIDRRMYPAHCLVFLLETGAWPVGQIDHINGVRGDNRIGNLRDVTPSENQQNRHRPQAGNKYPWVTWKSQERRWRAQFRTQGKDVCVGHFHSAESAYAAVLEKRRAMGMLISPALAEPKAEQGA